jgi:hypothetical protein
MSGEHANPTLAEAAFAARRKRKLVWADTALSPVKGSVRAVGVMSHGPHGARPYHDDPQVANRTVWHGATVRWPLN